MKEMEVERYKFNREKEDSTGRKNVTIQHNQQDIKKACHPRMFLSGIHKVKIWIMNIKLRFPD
jgi:hypothetical protein